MQYGRYRQSSEYAGHGAVIDGTIVSISGEKGKIRVAVDIGVDLQVLMDEHQFLLQPYQVLQKVSLIIPQQAVQIIS